MKQDLRHALRSLAKTPGFTAAALATLALGIGATTIVFSIVNGLLLRPLPFGDGSARVVSLHGTHPTQFPDNWDDAGVSWADLEDVRRESQLLEDVGSFFEWNFTLYGDESTRVAGAVVTPNLFEILNARPALGRGFVPEDGARIGFASVLLVSDALWHSRFGGDPEIVGRTILMNEREHTVIGVMPEGFRFPERGDIWSPYDPVGPGEQTNRSRRGFTGVAKMVPGATLDETRLELEAIASRLAELYPDTNRDWGLYAVPYRELLVNSGMRVVVIALLVAVGLVLLIGCANLASLLLARGTARKRELAVRAALGAGRRRLVRQMLVESLLLGCAGGALGTLFALWGIDAVVASFPEELPFWLSVGLDARVAAFIVGVSIATGIAFGLLPALRASKVSLTSTLGSGRDGSSGRRGLELQGALIVGQVAVSLALLVGAGIMVQSFFRLTAANPGFDGHSLLTMRIYLPGDAYDPSSAKIAFFRELVERARDVPGVAQATVTSSLPTDDGGRAMRIVTPEHPVADGTEIGVQVIGSTPGFFDTLGVTLLEGRTFVDSDNTENAPRVAIVNEALASRLWQGQSAENREIGMVATNDIDWLRIIGVAPHIQYEEFGEETEQSQLNVFVPYSQYTSREMSVLVRADSAPNAIAARVTSELKAFAPGAPLFLVRTMDEVRYMTTWEQRFVTHLFTAFAGAALLLACLGVYGLVAYHGGRLTHEIGVRVALGADSQDVLRLLLGHGVGLAAAGVVAGIVLAAGVSRVLGSVVYGSFSGHTALYVVTAIVLVVPILIASYVPARRAARIGAAAALREE